MEKKKLTEKDCLEEVLKFVKIFRFNKIDKSEIPQIRMFMGHAMTEYLKMTDKKRQLLETERQNDKPKNMKDFSTQRETFRRQNAILRL